MHPGTTSTVLEYLSTTIVSTTITTRLCVEVLFRMHHYPGPPRPLHRREALEELFPVMRGSMGQAPMVSDLLYNSGSSSVAERGPWTMDRERWTKQYH